MITRNHLGASEFHIPHAGQPCTVWRRAGVSYDMPDGGFFVPIERDGEDGREWHHITGVNAGDFHTADECPHILRTGDDRPPTASEPMLSLSDRSENGRYNEWGFDASGYDANGYDADGYDSGGYDRNGYDADGYDADGYDADGSPRPGSLDASDLDLSDLWSAFSSAHWGSAHQAAFRQHLRALVREPDHIDELAFCGNCDDPAWDDDLLQAQGGNLAICQSCWDDWTTCDCCNERYPGDDLTEDLSGSDICDRCRENYYSWCDECDGWYRDEDADFHDHASADDGCCESPQQEFAVRNDGDAPLPNDTRFTVTLPAGTITAEGLGAIRDYLRRETYTLGDEYRNLAYDLDKLGDQWQTKSGNYTRRLSRLAYQDHQVKLTQDVMSQVGCIAREHSTQVSVAIEVTRDLNLPADEFYHDSSCWWTEFRESRCALKTNGGFGLRSFHGDGYSPSGRAWVLPLRLDENKRLRPTFDALTPDAFVVFNGYGDLSGYAAPRIVAHMAGWTYRKIGFTASPMYVNAGGYLVAPEDIAQPYTDGELTLHISQHSSLFRNETTERVLVHA